MTNNFYWQRGITGTGPEPIALGAKMTKAEVLAEEIKAAEDAAIAEWFFTPTVYKGARWLEDTETEPQIDYLQTYQVALPDGSLILTDERAYNHMLKQADGIVKAEAAIVGPLLDGLLSAINSLLPADYAERLRDLAAPQQDSSQPPQPSGMATEPSTRDWGPDDIINRWYDCGVGYVRLRDMRLFRGDPAQPLDEWKQVTGLTMSNYRFADCEGFWCAQTEDDNSA